MISDYYVGKTLDGTKNVYGTKFSNRHGDFIVEGRNIVAVRNCRMFLYTDEVETNIYDGDILVKDGMLPLIVQLNKAHNKPPTVAITPTWSSAFFVYDLSNIQELLELGYKPVGNKYDNKSTVKFQNDRELLMLYSKIEDIVNEKELVDEYYNKLKQIAGVDFDLSRYYILFKDFNNKLIYNQMFKKKENL